MTKYKYYLRKPRSEIVKDVFYWLMVTGAVCFAATSPYFGLNLARGFAHWRKYKNKKKLPDTFKKLQKRGCIKMEKVGHQIYISLTEKGRKLASWLQIDDLKIKRPKKWDGKWRLAIFDISQLKKIYREAFRGKLKELGFYPLQKSVWIYPFDCRDEIELLKDFFGLNEKEVRLLICENIGKDDWLKKHFKI